MTGPASSAATAATAAGRYETEMCAGCPTAITPGGKPGAGNMDAKRKGHNMGFRKLTEEELESVRRLAHPDRTTGQIAELTGMVEPTIRSILVREGLPFKRRRYVEVQKIFESMEKGIDAYDISEILGLDVRTIRAVVKERTGMSFSKYQAHCLTKKSVKAKKEEKPAATEQVLTPCMVPRSEWPICRMKNCHLRHRCDSFQQAVIEGKVDNTVSPDTHTSGSKYSSIHTAI